LLLAERVIFVVVLLPGETPEGMDAEATICVTVTLAVALEPA
jgi:hypothetical protein